ncbi:MAG: hypothetical protein V6Z81_06695 [Parvularculales bacterium]
MDVTIFGHSLRHWLEAGALFSIWGALRLLGVKYASALGGIIARTIGPYLRGSRRIHDNLALAMPEIAPQQRAFIVKQVWENIGRVFAETPYLVHISNSDNHITCTGIEHIQNAAKHGKGIIFLGGHHAHWEMMLKGPRAAGLHSHLVYRHFENKLIEKRIVALRQRAWQLTTVAKNQNAASTIIKSLRSGKPVAMLVDERDKRGIEAKFFNLPALTSPTPAKLILRYDAPVILGSVTREPGPRFHVTLRPLEKPPLIGNMEQDIVRLTQAINDFLEACVRERPGENFMWMKDRWRLF